MPAVIRSLTPDLAVFLCLALLVFVRIGYALLERRRRRLEVEEIMRRLREADGRYCGPEAIRGDYHRRQTAEKLWRES